MPDPSGLNSKRIPHHTAGCFDRALADRSAMQASMPFNRNAPRNASRISKLFPGRNVRTKPGGTFTPRRRQTGARERLRRRVWLILTDITEAAGVRPAGIGERHGQDRFRTAVAAFDPQHLGEDGDRALANRRCRPAPRHRPPADDVRPTASRTGDPALMPHPHHEAAFRLLDRLMFVAANPHRPIQYARGHAGLPDRMVVEQPPIKPTCPHSATQRS